MSEKVKPGVTNKFWMVWNINGKAPTKQHDDPASAKTEAARLAAKHPEEYFAVLEAREVMIARINPVESLRCVKDHVPF